jgi:PBP1b-binding outer membrane lipoprotein LpoB
MRKLILAACGLVVLTAGLLMVGCNKEPAPTDSPNTQAPKTGEGGKGGTTAPPVEPEKPIQSTK